MWRFTEMEHFGWFKLIMNYQWHFIVLRIGNKTIISVESSIKDNYMCRLDHFSRFHHLFFLEKTIQNVSLQGFLWNNLTCNKSATPFFFTFYSKLKILLILSLFSFGPYRYFCETKDNVLHYASFTAID